MIEAVEVQGFRGLRRLKVEGLGRVNLIIGRNDSGKTALMEALGIATSTEIGSELAHFQFRRQPKLPILDFERFWLPIFWAQKVDQGFIIESRAAGGEATRIEARKVEPSHDIVTTSIHRSTSGRGPWSVELLIKEGDGERTERIDATSEGVRFPTPSGPRGVYWVWISPNRDMGETDIRHFSKIKQDGRDGQLLTILRQIDSRVSGVELLAPTGAEAEIFVRFDPGAPLLNIAMMGDGFQRCFEFGVSVVAVDVQMLFIDELENGLHHSVLEPVWRQVAEISMRRDLQIFATTHSEECVQAACRAFTAAADDGLRVIRLDRREEETVATVYDRSLLEAATRMGVEIRG